MGASKQARPTNIWEQYADEQVHKARVSVRRGLLASLVNFVPGFGLGYLIARRYWAFGISCAVSLIGYAGIFASYRLSLNCTEEALEALVCLGWLLPIGGFALLVALVHVISALEQLARVVGRDRAVCVLIIVCTLSAVSGIAVAKWPRPPSYIGRVASYPAEVGRRVVVRGDWGFSEVAVTVLEVRRGRAAWDIIRDASQSNRLAPPQADEYMAIRVRMEYLKASPRDRQLSVTMTDWNAWHASCRVYQLPESVVRPHPELGAQLSEGEKAEGWLAAWVWADESAPILCYKLGEYGNAWFRTK